MSPHVWPHCKNCPRVAAFDLALGTTGIVTSSREVKRYRSRHRAERRLQEITDEVYEHTVEPDVRLAVIEGYAYARANQAHQIGELGGVIRLMLYEHDIPFIVVAPSTVKKFATGKGNAGKPEVLKAAWKRLGYEGTDDNEADALWLWTIGMDLLGHPTVVIPSVHREAVDKLELPDLDVGVR